MESISVFDIIKVGLGPSSSHTMGPWKASEKFLEELTSSRSLESISHIQIHTFGSLAETGIGHGTDLAATMGLTGYQYETMNTEEIPTIMEKIKKEKKILLNFKHEIHFDFNKDIELHFTKALPFHPNGIRFIAQLEDGQTYSQTYYSIGGGFIIKEGQGSSSSSNVKNVPNDILRAEKWLKLCVQSEKSLSDIVLENELHFRTLEEIKEHSVFLFNEAANAVYRGLSKEGELAGGLKVQRRGKHMANSLLKGKIFSSQEEWMELMDTISHGFQETSQWISAFAIAVNEENAAFGRVITAPTNGASGVMPSVLMYANFFLKDATPDKIMRFMLVAGQIGTIFREHATISGAKGGCQAEIGVSSAMCAGALTEWMGGTPEQCLIAAASAMSHHLGLTCDPVAGLVQIPCIERVSMGALKAVNASYLAKDNHPLGTYVNLDAAVDAMWEIAQDMNEKYRETSKGGLAKSLSQC